MRQSEIAISPDKTGETMNESSQTGPLLYEVKDGIAMLTLNRPEKLNAFTTEMLTLWVQRLEEAQGDNAVRVIIVTGAGRGFCSGGDTGNMGGGGDSAEWTPYMAKQRLRNSVQRIPMQLSRMDKP